MKKILSAQTGVSVSNISRLKNHPNSNPTVATLKPIADYFEVSIDQLLGFGSIPNLNTLSPPVTADDVIKRLLEVYQAHAVVEE